MELKLKNLNFFKEISQFNFNKALVHQVIIAYAAGSRQGTSAQKTRAEVSGSKKKPWRQKGTGRARAGSLRSPIWRSGGVTFASKTRKYYQKVNKKMYRGALKSILSELIRQDRIIVFNTFSIEEPRTKCLIKKIKDITLKSILIIVNNIDNNLFLAARNIHRVNLCTAININPMILINSDKIIMTLDAVKKIEGILM